MPNDNRISAVLASADKESALKVINTLETLLPFLANLSPEERRNLVKMSDKTLAFDEKCVSYMTAHPELIPAYVNSDEVAKDRQLRLDLTEIFQRLQQLSVRLENTIMLAASDAYMADLAFYQNVRQAAKRGKDGADVIYADLKVRFPRTAKPKTETTPAAAH